MKQNKLNRDRNRQAKSRRQAGSRYAEKMIRQENDPVLSASGLRPSTRKRIAARSMFDRERTSERGLREWLKPILILDAELFSSWWSAAACF